jgi:phosphoribosylaminoimidazole carboxylase PurE protein
MSSTADDRRPLVGVVMGSDSDLPIMLEAVKVLDTLEIPFEVTVSSAHRSPERSAEYAATAASRGLKVIIAGAGLAAHLAGVMASKTSLPVIGVPISAGPLKGLDSLLSTVQMPPGVPVATVGLDAARNAGLLAAQILAVSDPALAERLGREKIQMDLGVAAKAVKIQAELTGFKRLVKPES